MGVQLARSSAVSCWGWGHGSPAWGETGSERHRTFTLLTSTISRNRCN